MKTQRAFVFLMLGLWGGLAQAQTVDTVISNGLFEPYAVTVDQDNSHYLADSANHRIAKYDPDTGLLTTLAGQPGVTGATDGPGFFAQFNTPRGILYTRGGLVVADSGNNLIRFLDISGRIPMVTTLAGSPTAGKQDGPASNARFNFPVGLATDAAGNIYIADFKNQAVRKLSTNNVVTTVATGFIRPTSLTVDEAGTIYVTDSGDNTIRKINADGAVSLLAGSAYGLAGSRDDFFAASALFNAPSGILWAGGTLGLLVSDTGNHTLRRLFIDADLTAFFGSNVWSVTTYAGKAGQVGLVNGLLSDARFFGPVGLCRDSDNGLLVVDGDNHALRRIQVAPARPPVTDPQIGYVIFVLNADTGVMESKLIPIEDIVFYNDPIIAVLSEPHTVTFTTGITARIDEEDAVPTPVPGVVGEAPPAYENGMTPEQVGPSMISPQPDITIKAIATAPPRKPSNLVKARIQFKVAPPVIVGDNPALFSIVEDTAGAAVYYTIDDSVELSSDTTRPGIMGPIVNGESISLKITNDVTFRAQAFRDHYQASTVVTKYLSPTNFNANRITFGFETGEASSKFVAAAGQLFYAPVTLSLLPSQKIYTLQFGVIVTNRSGPPVWPGAYSFESMLMKPEQSGQSVVYYEIPPAAFVDSGGTNEVDPPFFGLPIGYPPSLYSDGTNVWADLLVKNTNNNLLMVGWLERASKTNLYDTTKQDLITYSIAHDRLWESKNGKVILGGYAFNVPKTAASGQEYQLEIIRPSGTSDGISGDVYLETPTNGSLGVGSINALKVVQVGNPRYLVGDVTPFRWFNAGDFGDGWLLNNDVLQAYQSMFFFATNHGRYVALGYGLNQPPRGSDMFDAMDSSDSLNHLSRMMANGGDANEINQIKFGDGQLDVTDIYVTYRRSLDPSLVWYARYWSNGVLNAAVVPNTFRGNAASLAEDYSNRQPALPAEAAAAMNSTEAPAVSFSTSDLPVQPGQKVRLPIKASIAGPLPIRVLMLHLTVQPLEGAPPLTEKMVFTPVAGLGTPTFQSAFGNSDYSASWLNSAAAGLWGEAELGTLEVTIPEQAAPTDCYRLVFAHVSASPNGLGLFPQQVQNALLALGDFSQSSWKDAIPDSWRLRFFGTVANVLSQAAADADGDGLSNWAEFKTGTDPIDIRSRLQVWASRLRQGTPAEPPPPIVIKWPSVKGKKYVVESAAGLADINWQVLAADLVGTGREMQYADPNVLGEVKFYRVRISE